MIHLEPFRFVYARLITALGGLPPQATRLIDAFASVPRERFIGPGPWQLVTPSGYVTIPSDDPAFLYQDFAVALQPARHINNGQPSLHARCLFALQIKESEKIVHVGAGSGYYTALLAKLTGQSGTVVAYEVDPGLAAQAAANLEEYSNVTVQPRSGVEGALPNCDVLYVNAGATAPMDVWLDALLPGGRLLFPLTSTHGFGAMLLVTRTLGNGFAARFVCAAAFIHCQGARDEDTAQRLGEALKTGGIMNPQRTGDLWGVQSLCRNTPPDNTAWFAGSGWWLSKSSLGAS
jgi:protein-L-isoaspartate(D-aspartate) O-methyltransferase